MQCVRRRRDEENDKTKSIGAVPAVWDRSLSRLAEASLRTERRPNFHGLELPGSCTSCRLPLPSRYRLLCASPGGQSAVPENERLSMSGRPGPAAEASLLSAAQLRQIIDGATDTAIISIDRVGFVTSWSLGAQRLLGWTEEEMLGQKLDRLFTEEDRKLGQLAREMTDALAHGRGGGEEGWRIRKEGSRMWAAGGMSPGRSE